MIKKSISKDLKGHFLALGEAINNKPKSHRTWKTKELLNISQVIQNDQTLISYKLTKTEIYIISSAWYITVVDRKSRIDPIKLIGNLFTDPEVQLQKLDVIATLIRKSILCTYNKVSMKNISNNTSRIEQEYPKSSLINEDIFLKQSFLKQLFSEKNSIKTTSATPYLTNKELLFDWFKYIEELDNYTKNDLKLINLGDNSKEKDSETQNHLNELKTQIENRLANTKKQLPLIQITDEYNLDHNEIIIIMSLLKNDLDGIISFDNKVLQNISIDKINMKNNQYYVNDESKLVSNELVKVSKTDFTRKNYLQLNQNIIDKVLDSASLNKNKSLAQMISNENLFTILEPTQTIDDLILPVELKKTILSGFSLFSNDVDKTLQKWGLYNSTSNELDMNEEDNSPGFLLLFYGMSGTGKTFAAGSIGNFLGRKLLVTDMSKIKSKWVGESEQNVSRLFTLFDKIVSNNDNPPVLLLNEADQFLSKRISDISNHASAMHNTMQNLFLEALERIRGIVIATTNNITNLDPAFSRRFHIKVEFPMPGRTERLKLWQLFLPNSIPGSDKIDIDALSKQYEFTGGQINMIVRNSATVAASRSQNQRLMQSDIIKYCELEQHNKFDKSNNRIGFN